MENRILLSFTKEELKLISHSLYQTNNKLGYSNTTFLISEMSAQLQKRINEMIQNGE